MRIIGSVYEKDYVYPWDARGREAGIIKMPAAGDVAKTLHMFVYRGEALSVLCTESVTNQAINCPVNIHITFTQHFHSLTFCSFFLLFFCQMLTIYTTRSPPLPTFFMGSIPPLSPSTMNLLPTSFVDDFSFLLIKRGFLDPPGNFLHALSFIVLNNHLVPFL